MRRSSMAPTMQTVQSTSLDLPGAASDGSVVCADWSPTLEARSVAALANGPVQEILQLRSGRETYLPDDGRNVDSPFGHPSNCLVCVELSGMLSSSTQEARSASSPRLATSRD